LSILAAIAVTAAVALGVTAVSHGQSSVPCTPQFPGSNVCIVGTISGTTLTQSKAHFTGNYDANNCPIFSDVSNDPKYGGVTLGNGVSGGLRFGVHAPTNNDQSANQGHYQGYLIPLKQGRSRATLARTHQASDSDSVNVESPSVELDWTHLNNAMGTDVPVAVSKKNMVFDGAFEADSVRTGDPVPSHLCP
jgi:hypothetical protein